MAREAHGQTKTNTIDNCYKCVRDIVCGFVCILAYFSETGNFSVRIINVLDLFLF